MREFARYSAKETRTPTLVQKQERDTIISKDDILNLRIALELSNDVLNFVHDSYMFDP